MNKLFTVLFLLLGITLLPSNANSNTISKLSLTDEEVVKMFNTGLSDPDDEIRRTCRTLVKEFGEDEIKSQLRRLIDNVRPSNIRTRTYIYLDDKSKELDEIYPQPDDTYYFCIETLNAYGGDSFGGKLYDQKYLRLMIELIKETTYGVDKNAQIILFPFIHNFIHWWTFDGYMKVLDKDFSLGDCTNQNILSNEYSNIFNPLPLQDTVDCVAKHNGYFEKLAKLKEEKKAKEEEAKKELERKDKLAKEKIENLKKSGELVDGKLVTETLRWSEKRQKFYSCGTRGESIIENEQRLCIANCYYQSKTNGAADYTLTGVYTIVRKSQKCPPTFRSFKESELRELGANWY